MIKVPMPRDKYVQSAELLGTPKLFKVVGSPEYKKAERFGNAATGMSWFYYLQDENGDRLFQSNSKRLAIAFTDARLEVGDSCTILATGDGMERRYEVKRVVRPDSPVSVDEIPFA